MIPVWISILLSILPPLLNWLLSLVKKGEQLSGLRLERMNSVALLCQQVHNASLKSGCTHGAVNEDGTLLATETPRPRMLPGSVLDVAIGAVLPLLLFGTVGFVLVAHYVATHQHAIVVPSDPLYDTLAPAYKADADPDKAASRDQLASLFSQANASYLSQFKNLSDVQNAMHAAAQSLLGDKFMSERQVIATYLLSMLPASDALLTDDRRKEIADAFAHVADMLRKL
jgi:hypothetical protein